MVHQDGKGTKEADRKLLLLNVLGVSLARVLHHFLGGRAYIFVITDLLSLQMAYFSEFVPPFTSQLLVSQCQVTK